MDSALPVLLVDVLVYVKRGKPKKWESAGFCAIGSILDGDLVGEWDVFSKWNVGDEYWITHWQPLPNAPECVLRMGIV